MKEFRGSPTGGGSPFLQTPSISAPRNVRQLIPMAQPDFDPAPDDSDLGASFLIEKRQELCRVGAIFRNGP